MDRIESVKPDKIQSTVFQSVWQKIKPTKIFNWLLILVFTVFILLGIFLYVDKNPDVSPQQPEKTSQPAEQIPTDLPKPITKPEPYQKQWLWTILLLPLLTLLLWHLWWRYQAQLFLKRKSTFRYPNIKQLFVKDIDEGIFQTMSLVRVTQQLRKHTPIATDLLDIKATIKRTIQAGGWFTPVTGYVKTIPEYLVLIDRATFKDHHSHFIDALVKQLITQGVFVARYYFDAEPRHCYSEKDELAPLLLTELADRYPTHRLLIFSDGNGFIDPISGEIVPWIEQFSVWTQKTFFTLEQPEEWGYREKLLEKANFLILPANENGLTTLVEQINAGTWQRPYPKKATEDFTAFPAYFNDFSHWWLERHAPDRAKVTELLKQVRDFLGDEGYYWLSACAVYPELRWQLTLYLGYQLKSLTEERLAKLARLPWFRYGYMPNWLRKQLIKDLSLPQEREIRTVLYNLFLIIFMLGYSRLPIYPIEALWQIICYTLQKTTHLSTLRFVPVIYHNLSFFPHPFLARHIVLGAKTDPKMAQKVIDACAFSPGQRRAGEIALARILQNSKLSTTDLGNKRIF
ncbi:MAG: hypothetical protein ABFS56_34330 [Pseudomonadota bacterium]